MAGNIPLLSEISSAVTAIAAKHNEVLASQCDKEFKHGHTTMATILTQTEELASICDKEFKYFHTTLAKIFAQIEVLNDAHPSTSKRAARGPRKPPAADGEEPEQPSTSKRAARGPRKPPAADGEEPEQPDDTPKKIINAMQFFRQNFMAEKAFREKYRDGSAPPSEDIKKKVGKKGETFDEPKSLAAESMKLWKSGLDELQKAEIKQLYVDWKKPKMSAEDLDQE